MTDCSKSAVSWQSWPIKRICAGLCIAGAALAIWLSGCMECLSLQQLAGHREPLRAWVAENTLAAVTIYVVFYAAAVALSLPIAGAMTITGGFLFGWLIGGTMTVAAATAGAVGIFLLARTILAGPVARRAGPWLDKLRNGFNDNAISYLLFLRLVPVFPFWLVNLGPAVLGVRLRDYVLATFFGIMPITFALALAGAGLDSALAAHQHAYQECLAQNPGASACSFDFNAASLLTPELLFAFASFGVIALVPAIAKRLRKSGRSRG